MCQALAARRLPLCRTGWSADLILGAATRTILKKRGPQQKLIGADLRVITSSGPNSLISAPLSRSDTPRPVSVAQPRRTSLAGFCHLPSPLAASRGPWASLAAGKASDERLTARAGSWLRRSCFTHTDLPRLDVGPPVMARCSWPRRCGSTLPSAKSCASLILAAALLHYTEPSAAVAPPTYSATHDRSLNAGS